MVNHFTALCKATNSSQAKPISRSQLPILLAKVNGAIFSKLLLDWFNIELNTGQKAWFACDGKDLRAGRPEPKHTSAVSYTHLLNRSFNRGFIKFILLFCPAFSILNSIILNTNSRYILSASLIFGTDC